MLRRVLWLEGGGFRGSLMKYTTFFRASNQQLLWYNMYKNNWNQIPFSFFMIDWGVFEITSNYIRYQNGHFDTIYNLKLSIPYFRPRIKTMSVLGSLKAKKNTRYRAAFSNFCFSFLVQVETFLTSGKTGISTNYPICRHFFQDCQ